MNAYYFIHFAYNDVMQNSAGAGKKTRIYLYILNIRYYSRDAYSCVL